MKLFGCNSTNHGAFAEDALVVQDECQPWKKGASNERHILHKFRRYCCTTAHGGQWFEAERIEVCVERTRAMVRWIASECKLNPPTMPTPTCCARHRLGAQPDFQNQKSILFEALEETRHLCDFLPKFHCELPPIENYCDYSIHALRTTVSESLAVTLFLYRPSEGTSVVPIIWWAV